MTIEENKLTDISKLEELFKMHYASLCNVSVNIVHDRAAAEDVVQDVFLKIWNKRDKLVINTSLKGYLFRSTINTSLNYIESNKRNVPIQKELAEDIQSTVSKVEDQLVAIELQEKLSQSINMLPPKCKQVFMLSRFEGMKYNEIAEYMGISVKTVENQMSKALKRLRRYLHNYLPSTNPQKGRIQSK